MIKPKLLGRISFKHLWVLLYNQEPFSWLWAGVWQEVFYLCMLINLSKLLEVLRCKFDLLVKEGYSISMSLRYSAKWGLKPQHRKRSQWEAANRRTDTPGSRAGVNYTFGQRRCGLCLPRLRQRLAASENPPGCCYVFFSLPVNILKNQGEIHMQAYLVLLHFANVAFSYKLKVCGNPSRSHSTGTIFPTGSDEG